MAHWLLTAIDHRSEIWNTYPIQRIVVEAADEREARKRVAATAPDASQPNPWLDRALTSCEEVGASHDRSVAGRSEEPPGGQKNPGHTDRGSETLATLLQRTRW